MADEYIKREDALYAVDCDNLQRGIVDALQENLKDVSAADVAPVVRCKDCKHIQHDALFGQDWCGGRRVTLDWYCADGERKEQGE